MIAKLISSIFMGIVDRWLRSHKDQQLGAQKQRESQHANTEKQLEIWSDVEADAVSDSDAYSRLSRFGSARRTDDNDSGVSDS